MSSHDKNRRKFPFFEEENYQMIRKLGSGGFGDVFLVLNKKDEKYYALKIIDISKKNSEELRKCYGEIKSLMLQHENLIKLHEVFKCNSPEPKIYIVMEYAEGGDLFKKLTEHKETSRRFHESILLHWLIQICEGLKYLHKKKIIHRDIKPQNIFLTKDNNIKIGDFGISKTLCNKFDLAKTAIGTLGYLSPQIIKEEEYSFDTDIWSLGVTFYQLMTFNLPFEGKLKNLYDNITNVNYKKLDGYYSDDLRHLVHKMLRANVNDRPKAFEILNMPFIKKFREFYECQRKRKSENLVGEQKLVSSCELIGKRREGGCEGDRGGRKDDTQQIKDIKVIRNRHKISSDYNITKYNKMTVNNNKPSERTNHPLSVNKNSSFYNNADCYNNSGNDYKIDGQVRQVTNRKSSELSPEIGTLISTGKNNCSSEINNIKIVQKKENLSEKNKLISDSNQPKLTTLSTDTGSNCKIIIRKCSGQKANSGTDVNCIFKSLNYSNNNFNNSTIKQIPKIKIKVNSIDNTNGVLDNNNSNNNNNVYTNYNQNIKYDNYILKTNNNYLPRINVAGQPVKDSFVLVSNKPQNQNNKNHNNRYYLDTNKEKYPLLEVKNYLAISQNRVKKIIRSKDFIHCDKENRGTNRESANGFYNF